MQLVAALKAALRGRLTLRIEPLRAVHSAVAAALHQASFARGWDQPDVGRMLAEANILADAVFAGSEREPSGFVMSRLAVDEAEILTICVASHRQGQGLATLLLERHLDHLARRGVAKLFLEVDAHNTSALRLYRHFAFAQVGERPGYYARADGSRALALILQRNLD